MKQKYGFTGTICVFGLCGAFGASFLLLIWTWMFQPRLFNDGQYGMVFLITFPFGWILGSVVGFVRGLADASLIKPHHPFLTGLGLIVGGFIITPVPGMISMMLFLNFVGLLMELFKLLRW